MLLGVHRALAVHGLTQGVDHAANEPLAHGHGHHLAGAGDGIAFLDALVGAQHNDGHAVFLQVQGHAVLAVGEAHQLVGHAIIQAADAGDAVADHDDGAGIALGNFIFVVFYLLFNELTDLLRF